MSLLAALVLAVLQGMTEFLPISSSAHLILAPRLFGWPEHPLTFDVVTNAGTLTAAVWYFRHELREAWAARGRRLGPTGAPGLGLAVLAASVPVAAAGGLFYGWLSTAARDPRLIGLTTLLFGLLLGWADRAGRRHRDLGQLAWRDAALIGLAQALALVPGTSRSGVTITAALFLGFSRREAARFSFLLAIPAGVMALAKDLVEVADAGVLASHWPALTVGFLVAALSAYLVIGALLAWLERQTLTVFVIYRVVLGTAVLLWAGGLPP